MIIKPWFDMSCFYRYYIWRGKFKTIVKYCKKEAPAKRLTTAVILIFQDQLNIYSDLFSLMCVNIRLTRLYPTQTIYIIKLIYPLSIWQKITVKLFDFKKVQFLMRLSLRKNQRFVVSNLKNDGRISDIWKEDKL